MEIRSVDASEWREWREVRLRMLRDDARYFSTRYEDAVRESDTVWQDWVAEAAQGTKKTLLVATEGGIWFGVVGGFVRVDPSEVHLISMWIAPEARGRGLARRLIVELANWAATRSATEILLFVQEANAPARSLYQSLGFLPMGDRTPIGAGRTGFKQLLRAGVADLLKAES